MKTKVIVALVVVVGLAGFLWRRHPIQVSQKKTGAIVNTVSAGKVPPASIRIESGYAIHVFADGLGQARDLQFSPGGTLLVTDIQNGRVLALPDRDNNGVFDESKVVAQGVIPHGLAFYNGKLYVAELQKVVRYNWDESSLAATEDKVLFTLPANEDHNRRSIVFDKKGMMYVSVGSSCNVCKENDSRLATILQSDADGNGLHVFASGLRNAPFMAINPNSSELWATEMGRDNLGDNVPPDEINIIRAGVNYGWPKCYGAKIHDVGFDNTNFDPCTNTVAPIYQIPAHSAPLGLAFTSSSEFTGATGDLLVAYHGSWNRSTPSGYKVVILHVQGNSIVSSKNLITGFGNDTARPVDVIFDKSGNLYLSDDVAGAIYIIQKQKQ